MIAHIRGTLLRSGHNAVVIDVSGVGYKVFVTENVLASLTHGTEGKEVSLFTYLAVRENALDLYGFLDKEELSFFELLLTISGIGPKSALSILNVAPPNNLRHAILTNDSSYLTKMSGVGRKTADKIVLELQDKLGAIPGETEKSDDVDTLDALKALGYSEREVRTVLKKLPFEKTTMNERIKEALKLLGGK